MKPLPVAILAFSLALSSAHPDKIERDLLIHFATGSHKPQNNSWQDLTHRAHAHLIGQPAYTNLGPAQVLLLNGFDDYLVISDSPETAAPLLPKREFSVTAWVLLNDTLPDGGIIGLIQDNGDFEKGWLLGYNQNTFSFILSTEGADDGDGKLTSLRSTSPLALGQWQHLAATYDGTTMRLYLNGKFSGQSTAQSGNILYPPTGRFVLGAYADDNELHPMDGALYETKLYSRVLSQDEIQNAVDQNRALLEYRSSINQLLQFVVKPYLQFATTNSITIMAETTASSLMTVEYAEHQPLTNYVTTAQSAAINELTLTNLKPFTTYFYRVTCMDQHENIARSDIFSFQTLPPPDMPWAFGILGDTQRNPDVTRQCAEGIFALRPNFMLHCGDVVDDGFAKHQWVNDLFEPASRLFAYVPSFPVIGNHEKNSHWYYDYFSLPAPEYYYTFTVGNAQFFMIDSNKDCSPGSEQYRWLEHALASSTATWKFAAHHHPPFSSDENDYGDTWKGKFKPGEEFTWGDSNVKQLVPLYEKHGLDICFSGHIHSYERTWPILQMTINQARGVRYIVTGGGGGGLEQAAPQRAWFTIHVQRGHHYAFATVHDRTIQFKAYDLEGRLFDTFELTKPR